IAINLKGVWLCLKAEIRQMLTQGGGVIVNTASAAGLHGSARLAAYAASKHGVVGLTKSFALAYATQGMRINAVCPGIIHTPMTERFLGVADPEVATRVAQRHPMQRLGTAAEIADAVVWLCSDAASFITGTCLSVDGGWAAQ